MQKFWLADIQIKVVKCTSKMYILCANKKILIILKEYSFDAISMLRLDLKILWF